MSTRSGQNTSGAGGAGAWGGADRPRLSPTVVLCPVETGYLAYETGAGRLHELNPTAALVVELCDGNRTAAEVAALVGTVIGGEASEAVATWIATARGSGLLIEGAATDDVPPLTPEALAGRVERLRDRGQVRAAYVLQRRLVDLTPDEPAAWTQLGELAHILGRRDEARAAYERYQVLRPDDAEMAHVLRALSDQAPPARASDACITQLYARFASFYDRSMGDDLGYRAPELLAGALAGVLGERRDLHVLDLGCGTGLLGRHLRDRAETLVGIDLSPAMLSRARRRRIYDALHTAEITAWLEGRLPGSAPRSTGPFDLIVACDSLIYFGDLGQVLGPAAGRLAPGGRIGFTVEQTDQGPFRLTDSGRYAHHAEHLRATAAACGLAVLSLEQAVLRREYGEPVVGLVAVFGGAEGAGSGGQA